MKKHFPAQTQKKLKESKQNRICKKETKTKQTKTMQKILIF